MTPPSLPGGVPPVRAYAEFSLAFVLERSAAGGDATASARLDALEGTLAALTRRWNSARPLSPARDLRLAPGTLDTLVTWVNDASADAAALARLGVYHSGAVADPAVPRGWIRVYLGGERADPGLRRAGHA